MNAGTTKFPPEIPETPDTPTTVEKENIKRRFIVVVSLAAAQGGFLFGLTTAIISGALPHLISEFKLNEWMSGLVVSSMPGGCVAGALAVGILADRYGRRTMLIVSAALVAISGIGVGASHHLFMLICFRFIGGVGVGAAALLSPMYIAEVAPATWRGRLVAFYQLAIGGGILLAYLFNCVLANNWRWMFIWQAGPALVSIIAFCFLPETPRWLMKEGQKEKAEELLIKTTGRHAEKIVTAIEKSYEGYIPVSFKGLFKYRQYRPVLYVGICVAAFQQLTGINTVFYYSHLIFNKMGGNPDVASYQTLAVGIANVLAATVTFLWVDKVGRKKLLQFGSLVMSCCLFTVALCFAFPAVNHRIPLIALLLYTGVFGGTFGAVTWIYLSEIFSNRIRGLGMSVSVAVLWFTDLMVTAFFPVMSSRLGAPVPLMCYAVCCIIAYVYIRAKVKETKGYPLEKINSLFHKPKPTEASSPGTIHS
jgi:sugar porter (SP) family MFS transporter